MTHQLQSLIEAANPLPLIFWAIAYFFVIYLTSASLIWGLAKAIRRPIESRTLRNQQVFTEFLNSLSSVAIFGVGMLAPWGMVQFGLTRVVTDAYASRYITELLMLVLWNDLHFYALHRLLHHRLKRCHAAHHKSVTATPFAAYSMTVVEALLLGSVMPLAMAVHDFTVQALILLPLWSIFINTLSHSNCDFFPGAKEHELLGFIKHHQSHHSNYHGNYGFFFSQLDRWFGTSRPYNTKVPDDPI